MKMIPVAKPEMTQQDADAVAQTVLSGWILQGPKVSEFESKLAAYIDTPHAVATSSCTTAMHLGLLASGIKPGDEIIVPSLSFIATPNVVVMAGATPVFADIDERTYNIDRADCEKKITKKTKAILIVHQIGLPADMHAFTHLAKKYNLRLFEDAACGLGARIGGRHVGTFGDWGTFSFHPRKTITTAEGGLLATKSGALADKVTMLRAHGASVSVTSRHGSKKVLVESYPMIGYNSRMSDIHAALGISQFMRITSLLAARVRIALRYNESFARHSRIQTPFVPKGYTHTYQSYMIRLRGYNADTRKKLMQKLLDAGIATRNGVMASHLEPPYKRMYPKLKLPVTEAVSQDSLILPSYPLMTDKEQGFVITTLINLLK